MAEEIDMNDPYLVIHKGEPKYFLNKELAARNWLSTEDVKKLVELHVKKLDIFDMMHATDNPTELKRLAAQVTDIEFQMQATWHFPCDETYHEWYLVPKCVCPKLDNADYRGTDRRVHACNCPIHGD